MQQTILAVDDEPANLRMVERLLRKDYRVLTATSGEQGLEILKRETVALIITDQRMPGMTGTEMLKESLHCSPDAAKIILTGYSDIDALIDAINTSRVYKFVTKPWDPMHLKSAVEKALEERQKLIEHKRMVEDLTAIIKSYPSLFASGNNGNGKSGSEVFSPVE